MDPLTAAILYVVDKILEHYIQEEVWVKRIWHRVFPPVRYKQELHRVIRETVREYESLHPFVKKDDKFPFYHSQPFFEHLSTYILFKKGTLTKADYSQYPRVILPSSSELEAFYEIFYNKMNADPILKGKFIDENYKAQIYEIRELLDELNNKADAIKGDTEELKSIAAEIQKTLTKEPLSNEWFKAHLEESILNLGKRYSPEINLSLPIIDTLFAAGHDKGFKDRFFSILHELLKSHYELVNHFIIPDSFEELETIRTHIISIKRKCELINFDSVGENDKINTEELQTLLHLITNDVDNILSIISHNDKSVKNREFSSSSTNKRYGDFRNKVILFIAFLKTNAVAAFNQPYLLITGDAGVGKSHLLADYATKRMEANQWSILLLGQHFTGDEPWNQISKLLHLSMQRDELLTFLNNKGLENGTRVMILIDAINEGGGRSIWKEHLAGFIKVINKYHNLGLIITVRSSYEELLIPEEIVENGTLVKILHTGFIGLEYDASRIFFDAYGIKEPSIPLLHPEFSNPLFLKLFCEGLHKNGLTEIPPGFEGFTQIMNFYLDAVNKSISQKHGLPPKLGKVNKVIKKLAAQMATDKQKNMPYDKAYEFVISLQELTSVQNKAQFFTDLIAEGLLAQNIFTISNEVKYDGVYLVYEKFLDFLIAEHLLDLHLNEENPPLSFNTPNPLFEYVKNDYTCHKNMGIIEAMSVLIPERTGIEFFECAIHAKNFPSIITAFIKSLQWRKITKYTDTLHDYVQKTIMLRTDFKEHFLSTILTITSNPDNCFNSDYLHNTLFKQTMANRDANWSIFICKRFISGSDEVQDGIIQRIIDWSWTNKDRSKVDEESIRLLSQTICWFFSSPYRMIRDTATKAAISLLENRINVLIKVLTAFKNVNDPYISQRIYAVALGVASRSTNVAGLKELGNFTYEHVFALEEVIPDMLLRDYARNIIEIAVQKGHHYDFDMNNIRPPYKSTFPDSFPTKEDALKYYVKKAPNSNFNVSGMNQIYESMYADFGTFIFDEFIRKWEEADLFKLKNWAIVKINSEYGYDYQLHGEFDAGGSAVTMHTLEKYMAERIGKKYQWISLFEIAARVSDRYAINLEHEKDYIGSELRDIDPTTILKDSEENGKGTVHHWWNKTTYDQWQGTNAEWTDRSDDLPDPFSIIQAKDEKEVDWLVLQQAPTWAEPVDISQEKYGDIQKELWLHVRSYIIHKQEKERFITALENKNLIGPYLPEPLQRSVMFSREYYNSPAAASFCGNDRLWEMVSHRKTGVEIGQVVVTAIEYIWLQGYQNKSLNYYKPSKLIVEIMDLTPSLVESAWENGAGQIVCIDPSVSLERNNCLLVKRTDFQKALERNNLDVIWAVVGEKVLMGANRDNNAGRLNISGIAYFNENTPVYKPYITKDRPPENLP